MVDNDQPEASDSSSTSTSTSPPFTDPSASSYPPTTEYKPYDGNMGDYCKQLENWLGRAYWQRECAVSAYYTALGMMYPSRGMSGYQNGNVPGAGVDHHAQNIPGINNNNIAEPNLNMQNQVFRRFLVRGIRTNQNTLAFGNLF